MGSFKGYDREYNTLYKIRDVKDIFLGSKSTVKADQWQIIREESDG